MTNEQYYDLIKPYEDARRVMNTRLEVLFPLSGTERGIFFCVFICFIPLYSIIL